MLPPKVIEKLERRIEKLRGWRYAKFEDIPLEIAETMEHRRTPPDDLEYKPAPVGTLWGKHWSTAWFRGSVEIPRSLRGRRVYYRHKSFSDKLLFVDGAPFCGMNHKHEEALLFKSPRGGESIVLHVEAYTGHPIPGADPYDGVMYTHQFCGFDPGRKPPLRLEESALVCEREPVSGLYYDALVLLGAAKALDENSLRRADILVALNEALDAVPLHWETEEELEAIARAARKKLAPLMTRRNGPTTPEIGLVGHCHIDVGWLWPVRESIRKAGRSFASVLNLMDDYADFRFHQSQPCLMDAVESEYPDLLPRIKKRVKEGRWEPNGGMWVEADCNIPSGESLIRQFLEGRRKTLAWFGYRPDTLWLPDVFGYSAALPQILRGCEIENFVTSKINWNDTNRFPYDAFQWRGIDGSEIYAHFLTTSNAYGGYNADVSPETAQHTWHRVQHKDAQDGALCSVGWGDGGGGPTREMCECAARMKDLEGCPKAAFTNVSAFLKQQRERGVRLPRWSGELYLEFHRGTYTTQARIKRYNRQLELMLREAELYAAMAMSEENPYPEDALRAHWRTLLTNQFHDILPGSSIRSVYETAEEEMAGALSAIRGLRDTAIQVVGRSLVCDSEGAGFLVANSLSWTREALARVPAGEFNAAVDAEGAPIPCQRAGDDLFILAKLSDLSVQPIALRKRGNVMESPFRYSAKLLETQHYKIGFDKTGKLSSLYDKAARRELVQEGRRLNNIYTAEDIPIYWDAWDIERYYRDTVNAEDRLLTREVVEDGPLFMTVRTEYSIGRFSKLIQDMTVYAHSRRIDFRTEVDWKERHTILKVGFPLDIHGDTYRSEIQFGHVERPRHANTGWDRARFESCCHKWVDWSEGAYGAALLNDCKYGHDVLDDQLSLTLLCSPICPDEEADQGLHEFTYALLPHDGPFSAETVVREAYALNTPPAALPMQASEGRDTAASLCSVSNPNTIVEAVKKAEADDALTIRVYEAGRTRSRTKLTFARGVKKASACNMVEEQEESVRYRDQTVSVTLKPFEIKTLKVYLR